MSKDHLPHLGDIDLPQEILRVSTFLPDLSLHAAHSPSHCFPPHLSHKSAGKTVTISSGVKTQQQKLRDHSQGVRISSIFLNTRCCLLSWKEAHTQEDVSALAGTLSANGVWRHPNISPACQGCYFECCHIWPSFTRTQVISSSPTLQDRSSAMSLHRDT